MARRVRCLGALLVVCLAASPAWAAAPRAGGMLVTLAELSKDDTSDYRQYEGYVAWPLKWKRRWDSGWRALTELQATAGTIRLNGQRGWLASVGPLAALVTPGGHVMLHAGIRPTALSRNRFGTLDLGLWFQFTSHVGIALRLGRGFVLGYRLQHMSNAGTDNHNPGVNLSTLELRMQW